MNVKFRMPKLGRDMTVKGGVKELLMTFLGTTISIVLTFGTAAWIEKKEAEESRRLLAMTIVSDIDQSLEVINNRLKYEDECRGISYYLMWNCHRLEEIGSDSITAFLNYVLGSGFPRELEMETSNEHIFNSSQDSWRTLSDKKFLKNVQDFYNARSYMEQQRKESVYFKKPVSNEEEYSLIMESDDMKSEEAVLATCRRLLQTPRVQNYIGWSGQRMRMYYDLMQYINVNEENKFLMGITEKEPGRVSQPESHGGTPRQGDRHRGHLGCRADQRQRPHGIHLPPGPYLHHPRDHEMEPLLLPRENHNPNHHIRPLGNRGRHAGEYLRHEDPQD